MSRLGHGNLEKDLRSLKPFLRVAWAAVDSDGSVRIVPIGTKWGMGAWLGPGIVHERILDQNADGTPYLDAGGEQQVRYALRAMGEGGVTGAELLSGTKTAPSTPVLNLRTLAGLLRTTAPTTVYDVSLYGAVGDGVHDDTAALNAAWTAMSNGDALWLPAGTYGVSDTVVWTDKDYVTIYGNQATIQPLTGSDFTNKAVVDLSGILYANVDGLRVDCTLATNRPDAGVVLSRIDAGDGAGNQYNGCRFAGAYTFATVYDVGSELITFTHCFFHASTVYPCYYTSSEDDANLVPLTSLSNVCKRFYSCWFMNFSDTTAQKLIVCNKLTKELSLRDCYLYLSETGRCISLEGTTASMYGLTLENIRVEGPDKTGSRLLYIGQDNPCASMVLNQLAWSITSDYVIEAATAGLTYAWINALYQIAGTTKLLKVSENCAYNVILGRGDAMISVDTGKYFIANHLTWFSAGSPFTGAGHYGEWGKDDNVLNRLYDYDSEASGATRRQYGSYTDSGTTPAVTGMSLIGIYGDARTITNFTGQVPGQTITLVATVAVVEIAHNSTIILSGGVAWTMPTGATLTLVYFAQLSAWYEIGRMQPS